MRCDRRIAPVTCGHDGGNSSNNSISMERSGVRLSGAPVRKHVGAKESYGKWRGREAREGVIKQILKTYLNVWDGGRSLADARLQPFRQPDKEALVTVRCMTLRG